MTIERVFIVRGRGDPSSDEVDVFADYELAEKWASTVGACVEEEPLIDADTLARMIETQSEGEDNPEVTGRIPDPGSNDANCRHSWVTADEDNGGDGRSYCQFCGADGDA